MYSLYRAWLSLGPAVLPGALTLPSSSPNNNNNPLDLAIDNNHSDNTAVIINNNHHHHNNTPDICLQVGPNMTTFSAHRTVLAAHSGFFKAAIVNHSGIGPIAVPNVNVDEFSALLTFMYTGYLDLNVTNIYNILLATHILHMPRALEMCRAFLMHQTQQPQQQQEPQPQHHLLESRIIKPIPSRKLVLSPQQQAIYAPTMVASDLRKSERTPFRAVEKSEAVASTSMSTVTTPNAGETLTSVETKTKVAEKRANPSTNNNNSRKRDCNSKIIIDIACCDGPVRFHRVVNRNYGSEPRENDAQPQTATAPPSVTRNDVFNKVLNENIRDKKKSASPSSSSTSSTSALRRSDENRVQQFAQQSSDSFTCLYCNHTFKSQYCYQKHARRHLHPVAVDGKCLAKAAEINNGNNSAANGGTTTTTSTNSAIRREVKLLDMNVQYYPCKTCGSKFPSYYFVHKHRKLCHPDEMADTGNKNNEMIAVQQQQSNNQEMASASTAKNNDSRVSGDEEGTKGDADGGDSCDSSIAVDVEKMDNNGAEN